MATKKAVPRAQVVKRPPEPTPAEAAAAEAVDGTVGPQPIKVEFRGQTFDIRGDIINKARFRLALASMMDHQIVYEALGPINAAVFLALVTPDDDMDEVAAEFIASLNKAAGWGNS